MYVTHIVDTEHNLPAHIYSIPSPFLKVMYFKAPTYNKTMLLEVNALLDNGTGGVMRAKDT